jgi:hypothetical protein
VALGGSAGTRNCARSFAEERKRACFSGLTVQYRTDGTSLSIGSVRRQPLVSGNPTNQELGGALNRLGLWESAIWDGPLLINGKTAHVGTNPNTNCCLGFILRLFSTKRRTHN